MVNQNHIREKRKRTDLMFVITCDCKEIIFVMFHVVDVSKVNENGCSGLLIAMFTQCVHL